ncbi:MAG: MFS transporter, partial [Proteobacteria bacterium]|nr:MFS transporter [Pseudomonadota bacterium]
GLDGLAVGPVIIAAIAYTDSVRLLALIRFVNGIGAGLGFTVCCVAVVGTRHVERSYAVLYGSPFLISGIGLALLPRVYQSVGLEGAFLGMAALNVAALFLLPFMPRTLGEDRREIPDRPAAIDRRIYLLCGLVLGALFLHYVSNSGIWTYFERLGVAAGMTAEAAGAILGPGMSAAIVGMVAASVLGDKLGYLRPIYIGTGTILVSTLALLFASQEFIFGVATAAFNASITFVIPYFVAILAMLVPSGLGVTAANVMTIAGFSTGPFVISFIVGGGDFTVSILVTAAGFVAVFVLVRLFARRLDAAPGELAPLRALCVTTSN